jgi:uncharacterized protein (UPF0297 family)
VESQKIKSDKGMNILIRKLKEEDILEHDIKIYLQEIECEDVG